MIRLSTRGSKLALWQANETQARLGNAELIVVESSGDRDRVTDLARFGSIGIFTVEVDRAVLDGRADVGVHSLKDMTTTLQDGIVLMGVLPRGLVEDVLVTREPGLTLDTLPPGAVVGTGSLRRAAMLRAARPDLVVAQARGNVPTRIAKVKEEGAFDAAVLARAGIERLGLGAAIDEVLDPGRFLPAVGQGIVGLTCREDDSETQERLAAELRDADAWPRAMAERSFLRTMKGGCNAPVGGHARLGADGTLSLAGRVLSVDGSEVIEGRIEGAAKDAEALGVRLADDLAGRGGAGLIEKARELTTP